MYLNKIQTIGAVIKIFSNHHGHAGAELQTATHSNAKSLSYYVIK